MLKFLTIENLILVEKAEIPFCQGLNIITGETGAGKSAVMEALSLVLGERADLDVIRKGASKGIVEAHFLIQNPELLQLLNECGIDCEEGELIIRREISNGGKSRTLVNHQAVQLNILRQIAEHCILFVGQHAQQILFSNEEQRRLLDAYGEIDTTFFQHLFNEENRLKTELDELMQNETSRIRDLEACKREIEEIEEINPKIGEDEELFQEYTRLSHAEEFGEGLGRLIQMLSGEEESVNQTLKKERPTFEKMLEIDPSLNEAYQLFNESSAGLEEVSFQLERILGKIEYDPKRLEEVNERLSDLHKLKRKFGPTLQEVHDYWQKQRQRLESLENSDERKEALQQKIVKQSALTNKSALEITEKRKKAAIAMAKEVVSSLRGLNMPKVEFTIRIEAEKRSSKGDDHIEFMLAPNIGEREVSVKDCASGGELSRLMLAIQSVLAGKQQLSTIVFDEIDANIGGETAVAVGKKLQEMGRSTQVICITHFPQVAIHAHHHLRISKSESEGRTFTTVERLDVLGKEKELIRMRGGH